MVKLSAEQTTDVERAISEQFPDYTFKKAPRKSQGQNSYCFNYILEKENIEYLLKVIFLEKVNGSLNEEQVRTEIEACKTVTSRHVISLTEHKETDSYSFLLFPFAEGKTLTEKMDEVFNSGQVFNENEIRQIVMDLVYAVSDIYRSAKIIHQDIKPENIILTDDGGLKLLDFGAARYKKSPFRGAARHNYAFSSPEQIATSRPRTIHEERRVIDDRSDVFGVGLIAYKLATGNHPYSDLGCPADGILAGQHIPPIDREDLSTDFKEIIYSMLSFHNANRPHASALLPALMDGKYTPPTLPKGEFYYCATNGVGRFNEMSEKFPSMFDGLITYASKVPSDRNALTEARLNSKTFVVDPQTYLFQKPNRINETFKNLPYYRFYEQRENDETFVQLLRRETSTMEEFADCVIQNQIDSGASALVPSFFYIEDFNDDAWDADQEITAYSIEKIKALPQPRKIIKGIAIQQGVLNSTSKENIIEYLTSLEDVDGYLLLLDSAHDQVITDESWLKSAQDLFTRLLATGKSVIWSHSDISGIVLSLPGLSLAMGESLSSRKFHIDSDPPGGGRQGTFYYVDKLFVRAKWTEAITALRGTGEYAQILCTKPCCEHVDFNNPQTRDIRDLSTHLLKNLSDKFELYSSSGGRRIARADLAEAQRIFGELRQGEFIVKEALRRDVKPGTQSFLDNWSNVLRG